jgi:hypothetical protein
MVATTEVNIQDMDTVNMDDNEIFMARGPEGT